MEFVIKKRTLEVHLHNSKGASQSILFTTLSRLISTGRIVLDCFVVLSPNMQFERRMEKPLKFPIQSELINFSSLSFDAVIFLEIGAITVINENNVVYFLTLQVICFAPSISSSPLPKSLIVYFSRIPIYRFDR